MCHLRRAVGRLSTRHVSSGLRAGDLPSRVCPSPSSVFQLLQRLVSRLLARSRESLSLGRAGDDDRLLSADLHYCCLCTRLHCRLCSCDLRRVLSTDLHRRLRTGQHLLDLCRSDMPNLFDLLKLRRELRADLWHLFDMHRELRSNLQHLLDLCDAGDGERSRIATCV